MNCSNWNGWVHKIRPWMIHLFLFKFDYCDIHNKTLKWPLVKFLWESSEKEKRRSEEWKVAFNIYLYITYIAVARYSEPFIFLFIAVISFTFAFAPMYIYPYFGFVFVSFHIHNHFLWNVSVRNGQDRVRIRVRDHMKKRVSFSLLLCQV